MVQVDIKEERGEDSSLRNSSISFKMLVTDVNMVYAEQMYNEFDYVLLLFGGCFIPQDFPKS